MRRNGFTLLEVLVAMVVLSIGLLGLASMMASTMRNNHSAYHRSQATWLAYDIIDRMRVNRASALAPSYNIALGVTPATPAGTPPPLSAVDVFDWKTQLGRSLPAGDGSVTVTPATRAVTVIICWDDSRGTGGGTGGSTCGGNVQGNVQQFSEFRVDSQL
jgi:type IV pilus assembly protein PilV